MKTTLFPLLIILLLLSSCVSFKPSSSSTQIPISLKSVPIKGRVINADQFKKEYRILKSSSKFEILTDSTLSSSQIELKKMKPHFAGCVTPQVTVLILTLGFYPVRYTEKYIVEYDIITGDKRTNHTHEVEIEKMVSWFHLFSPKKK